MGTFSEWSPNDSYVQSGMMDGRYATAAFTLLAAGPPRLANIGGAAALASAIGTGGVAGQAANQIVFPIGIVQNFGLSQNKNFARLWEIGSSRSYFVGGRTQGSIGLGRVYYHGPSLLRVLYAYYQELLPPTLVPALFPNAGAQAMANPHDVINPPGYDNIFMNLASDMFDQPVGLLKYIRDINEDTLGAAYFEHVVVPSHSWQFDSQGILHQEQAQMQYERMLPVQVAQLGLITNQNTTGSGGSNVNFPGLVAA